jgi:ligand-binding SRPBCC domain-containing protein
MQNDPGRAVASGLSLSIVAHMLAKKPDSDPVDVRMTSRLRGSRSQVWTWISSIAGISEEMRPYFRMTSPEGVQNLADFKVQLGEPFLHSRVFLFGFIPAGTWDFTLVELEDKSGFVEQSPSTFMKSWRHERRILDDPTDPSTVLLSDHVTFVPTWGRRLVGPFLQRVFEHRHRILRKQFGDVGESAPTGSVSPPATARREN